ncbi:MAG: translation initiation factor IF-2 N-terminal domain-containing protein, partial [Desulfobacterales bacterium]
MAKIRIYELARDLNVTNKELVEKIRDMDIDVKSHMSSLDDEEVTRIKNNLLGLPQKEVEETRIKPSIIRRRKKRVSQMPVQAETAVEPTPHPEKTAVADQPSEKTLKDREIPPEKEPEETPKEDAPEGAVVQPIVSKEKDKVEKPAALKKLKKKKAAKKIKKDVPAKIIKLPVTPDPEKKEPKIEKDRVHKPKAKLEKISPPTEVSEPESPPTEEPVKDKKKKKKWTKKLDEAARDRKF